MGRSLSLLPFVLLACYESTHHVSERPNVPRYTHTHTHTLSHLYESMSFLTFLGPCNDEEAKRQLHLIRNRQGRFGIHGEFHALTLFLLLAASKCRQKKKEWIAHLQETVAAVSSENHRLQQQVLLLREEILHLKTLLLACRACSMTTNA